MMLIYEALKDIDWHWCKCKKGSIISIVDSHKNFFLENQQNLRVIGSFSIPIQRMPHIMDKKVLNDSLRLMELQLSGKINELHAIMKREGIVPMGGSKE